MSAEDLEAEVLWPMKEYIRRWQDTIVYYILNHPIYELCTGAENIPGSRRFLRWWDQDLTREEESDDVSEGEERGIRETKRFLNLKIIV